MSKKLLLADDSITIQKVVELILADEGFEIKAVGDGEHAWNVMKEFRPDIVLADIEMPKMNGYQLSDKIKKDEETSGIPVILLAGAFEPIDEDLLKEVGADDYIVKPFESQELISKINAIFAERNLLEEEVAGTLEEVEEREGEVIETAEAAEEVMETAETAEAFEATAEPLETAEPVGSVESAETETEEPWEEELSLESSMEPSEEALEEELGFEDDDETAVEFEEIKGSELSLESGDMGETGVQQGMMPAAEDMKAALRAVAEEKLSEALGSIDSTDLSAALRAPVEERMRELLESFDLRQSILDGLNDLMKPVIERIILDTAPKLIEETVRDMMEEISTSLKQQVEKVIWETVPDLAETIINREVEEIKATL
ncbi:MAG: response regulator [Nitrospirae bacterium]|nr:response regulator [Nitrospirota bacterium]